MDAVRLSFGGRGLNQAEQVAVSTSLLQLKLNEEFKALRFWGKVFAVDGDYIIIQGVQSTDVIQKKYFVSSDGGNTFGELPRLEAWISERSRNIVVDFTGNPGYIYPDPSAPPTDEDEEDVQSDDEDAQAAPKVPAKVLTEFHRLAHAVAAIDRDTSVVPNGAHILTASREIIPNKNFRGLSVSDSGKPGSYSHFRNVENPRVIARLQKRQIDNTSGFLDPIAADAPKGSWSVQTAASGLEVQVRSLAWLGYIFRHETNTNRFVDAYFGSGVRNHDLVFMV